MALRYLAGRIGVPALRRASGSRLAQPAGTPRRLSSSSHQGGHDNGARKPLANADLDKLHAEFEAEREAFKERVKQEAKDMRFLIGTCCTGMGAVLLSMWYATYTEIERSRYWRSKLLE